MLTAIVITAAGPTLLVALIAWGFARLLDRPGRRARLIATVAAPLGVATLTLFFVRHPTTVRELSASFYSVGIVFWFCVLPTIVAAFAIAAMIPEVRAAWRNDPLIDLSQLPANLLEPIEPYLHDVVWSVPAKPKHRSRMFARGPFGFHRRNRPHIRQSEFDALYARHLRLISAREQAYRQQTTTLEVEQTHKLAAAKAAFVDALTDEDRGLLALRIAARAAAEAATAVGDGKATGASQNDGEANGR